MKKVLLFMAIMVSGMMAKSQSIVDTVTINNGKPQVTIKVNKVYDENGNVVGYDSTYVWSYSNSKSETTPDINPDSLFRAFKPWFEQQLDVPSSPFSKDFFNDSTMYLDFFNNEHFFDQWQNELFDFNNEIKKMDSLKQLFFKRYLNEESKKAIKGNGER